jgi:hypothetical protein
MSALRKQRFERNGFLCVPRAFSPHQVRETRAFLLRLFGDEVRYEGDVNDQCREPGHGGRSVRFDVFARYPELSWVLTHPPVVAVLREVLGEDFVYLPETAAQDSGFGRWHKDTHDQEDAGLHSHREPDYRMVQVAFYLQDNSARHGGGLDVIPGSHRRRESLGTNVGRLTTWQWLKACALGPREGVPYAIPSRAGDLVLFDYRVEHRATWPKVVPVPEQHRKLAIFFGCSANNRHVRSYIDFLSSLPPYRYLKEHAYPDEVLRAARAQQLTLL